MPKTAYAVILAFALAAPAAASAAPPVGAVPQAASQTVATAAVQKVQYRHYRRARHRYRDGRKIACTPGGCHPIPRGCYPTPQLDWRGNPTGYDAIVCPRR
ncbi:MAG TPA: hypothetical protein VE224_13100 [Pseudolabrys sp.]|nr:hypothetical protein [Pseudolabrys sp.]